MTFQVREADAAGRHATMLMRALDEDLQARYPGAVIKVLEPSHFAASGGTFLVGYEDDVPVACGALRRRADGSAEIKRMFVRAEARRRGHARAMLQALEAYARDHGIVRVRLETGDGQPEAVRLYERCGYRRIPCFDEYEGSPHSHCFEKQLPPSNRVP